MTISKICISKSDEYADIENVYEIDLSYKSMPIVGRGFVSLLHPERFPNIFNPESEYDCLFLCFDEAGLKYKTTLHQIKQTEKIGGCVSVNKIRKIIAYITTPIRLVLHSVKEGVFSPCIERMFDGSERKRRSVDVHIGHIMGHFFLIKDLKDLKILTASDFSPSISKDDNFITKLKTTNPVKVHDFNKGRSKIFE